MNNSGFVIVAFDTTTDNDINFSYKKLAMYNAQSIVRYTSRRVTIITDSYIECDSSIYSKNINFVIVDPPIGQKRTIYHAGNYVNFEWKNNVKHLMFKFSPYQRTIGLDADYIVGDDTLDCLLEVDYPFMIPRSVRDISGKGHFDKFKWMPNRTIPHCWATVMVWDKDAGKPYIELALEVEKNYSYYAKLFGFSDKQFRNDYVYSIVSHLMDVPDFPFPLPFASAEYHNWTYLLYGEKLFSHTSYGMFQSDQKDVIFNTGDVHILSKPQFGRIIRDS